MRNHLLNCPITRAILLWLVIFLPGRFSFSQTTNISNVVNSYYRVTGLNLAADAVRVNSTAGINQGDRILIIQMKGANINTDSPSLPIWGDTTNLNEAGNYEMAIVCRTTTDSVYFVHDLINNYNPASNTLQLVKFGEYVNAIVTDTLRATPWNSATGTGGVIAISVEDDLILNSAISVERVGFAGGAFVFSGSTCFNTHSAYSYPAVASGSTQLGAQKGEGVAVVAAGVSGGRGAPANGGGGGNNHNNSGGGGGNLASGGLSGGNSSSTGCLTPYQGQGGKRLSSWGGKKLFMGGGGGAGHNNNNVYPSYGGNGGGVIIIIANRIIGNGNTISANGQLGGRSQGDGAGGGGGGGTIVMQVTTSYDNVTIRANGADGGMSNDGGTFRRCYGGGGGGSGGAIYFNGATPSTPGVNVTVIPGAGGVELDRDVSVPNGCVAAVVAQPGNTGSIINSYAIRMGTTVVGVCSELLPVRLISFKAALRDKKVNLQWTIASPEEALRFEVQKMGANNEWTTFSIVTANDIQKSYSTDDLNTLPGYNSYRLMIVQKSGAVFYSMIRRLYVESDNDQFTLYPNPAHDKIFIKGNYNGFIDLKLLDVSGKSIMTKRSMMNMVGEVDLPSLPAGIYILHVNNTIQKLVIR